MEECSTLVTPHVPRICLLTIVINFIQERLARLEQDIHEEELRQQEEANRKVDAIKEAERRRHAPVDDSQMVDEMFDFIDEQNEGEGSAPSAFKVGRNMHFVICKSEWFVNNYWFPDL